MTFAELKAARPLRFKAALFVYRALWWPVCAVLIPFAVIGYFVDWLSWTALPAIARFFQPIGGAAHAGALRAGHAVLGYRRPQDQDASK